MANQTQKTMIAIQLKVKIQASNMWLVQFPTAVG